jgi:tetratricopeptide (TPR) repeat protein
MLAAVLLLAAAGCQSGNKSVDKLDSEEYKKLAGEIDRITADFGTGGTAGTALPIAEEFRGADDKKKAGMAIELADDMAQAQLFGMVNKDILAMSGEAVKAYPHPLLLNNYGALLLDAGRTEDSLYFFTKAEQQDAQNPVLLTNIANTYLELGDFPAAENYAKKALAAAPDFGAAYQVLTTVYLQKEQHKLAAEYLLKSAKHCFNDISEYQFESFLDAAEQLDPERDEYPVEEQQIEDFRKTAIENVDTKELDTGVDTPAAQVKIKPFPQVGSPDNLMTAYDYLAGEHDKYQQRYAAASEEIMTLSSKISDRENSGGESEGLVYPVEKNLRQRYALEVLQSYYEFKIKQSHRSYLKKVRETEEERNEELERLEKNYEGKRELLENDSISREQLLADLFSVFDTKELPNLNPFAQAAVTYQKVKVDECRERLNRSKAYASEIVNLSEDCYNETKQLLEEFWLKAGGLLKCLADEDVFKLYDMTRQQVVYSYVGVPVLELENQASFLERQAFDLRMAEKELETAIAFAKQAEKAQEDMEAAQEDYNGGDTVPDMEKEAISVYPEKNELGAIGAEVEAFGFSGSLQYASEWDGDKVKIGAGAPVLGSMGGDYTLNGPEKGTKNACAVHGVTVAADTGWFSDTDFVENALKNSGKAGKVGKALGEIGFGFSKSKATGQFVQTGSNGHITDRGVVYVRETSGSIGPISKTEKVEVRKSLMTGVAIKQTTTKYKFMFFTYEK